MKVDNSSSSSEKQAASPPQPSPDFIEAGTSTKITPKSTFKNKPAMIFTAVALLILLGGVVYYFGTKGLKINLINNEGPMQAQDSSGDNPTATIVAHEPLFTGQLKKVSRDLGVFKLTEDDLLNEANLNFIYYEAGIFNRGELKDYTRVVAIRPAIGPGKPLVFILATKDFQSYVLDDPDNKTTKDSTEEWDNPYSYLDKNKIVSTKTFVTDHPTEIYLNKDFALYFEEFPIQYVQTGEKDKYGNQEVDAVLVTSFSAYQEFTSPFSYLRIYFKPFMQDDTFYDQLSPDEKNKFQLRQKYFLGDTQVVVVDAVGLPVVYSMTTSGNIRLYHDEQAEYKVAYVKYLDQIKTYQKEGVGQYPRSPDYVHFPTLGFSGSQINDQNNSRFFNKYEMAIPGGCAISQNSKILKVVESELEQVGSVSGISLYRLKDTNHPLYLLAYNNKMEYYDQDFSSWDQVNNGLEKPTLAQYVAQNPLLFIKNYWQQWVALGEYDIQLPGGCGKPVVYLYPTQPTEVSVRFQIPVQLTIDIPKYVDSWKVKAYPDGSLVNLKSELTDCAQIDSQQKGSEYARLACLANTYPYLYWAGNIISKTYPVVTDGWIVEKNNLNSFLNEKLTRMGLNEKEKNDFTSYWISEMQKKNAPYYRISFLQTNDLNTLFPMTVIPRPDTIFRVFLDYTALAGKPEHLPQPQSLDTLVRKGFTLVEWGGLKLP